MFSARHCGRYLRNFVSNSLKHGSFGENSWKRLGKGPLVRTLTTQDNLSYKKTSGSVPLVDMTVGQLLERAGANWPNREAFVSVPQGVRLTYKQALNRADRIAAGLRKLGLEHGDRVAIWGPNDVEWCLAFLGIARAGLVGVGINPAYRQSELDYCIDKVQVKAVIAATTFKTQDYAGMLLQTKNAVKCLQHIILWSPDHHTGAYRLVDIESLGSTLDIEAIGKTQEEISPYDTCNIQFTSGTTGSPKAPMISHRSFVNNGIQSAERVKFPEDHHRICFNVPFFHVFGIVQGLMTMLHSGSTVILESPSFNPKAAIDAIVKEKCTGTYGTPTMLVSLLSMQQRLEAPMDSLKFVLTGGANASPDLVKNMWSTFDLDNFFMIYGLTESTAVMFSSLPGEPRELTESTVGCLQCHYEAKVVDEAGALVPFGTPGELLARGYSIMMGYSGDPQATQKTIDADGWLRTGDKFVLREDGYGQIVGRIKDMIIRGGENIYPKEIEGFLETHSDILEAQVFGVADEVYGEEVCACIRLKGDAKLSAENVRFYAKGRIAHFKIPRYIFSVDEFPKTTSGKIQKFKLREELERKKLLPQVNAQ